MAKNRRYANGRYLDIDVAASNGSGTGNLNLSGDPVAVGFITGVCLTDEDANGQATIDRGGVYELSVTGADDMGNSAVKNGDKLFWDDAAGQVNKDQVNGVFFGWAYDPTVAIATDLVAAGATTAIKVIQAGGEGALA